MSMFNWLLIGHLVGDWMLQNDWMARNKQRRWFSSAILVHCMVYTLVLLITLWWAGKSDPGLPYLPFATTVFVSHWLIDAGRLAARWAALLRQTRVRFVQVMVDQTMHLIVLAVLVELLLK
jgi:hypothetical protein